MIGYVGFDERGVIRKERDIHPPILLLGEDILKFGLGLHSKSKKNLPLQPIFLIMCLFVRG